MIEDIVIWIWLFYDVYRVIKLLYLMLLFVFFLSYRREREFVYLVEKLVIVVIKSSRCYRKWMWYKG